MSREQRTSNGRVWHRLYYAFNRWRYGEQYGCGRCHHAYQNHMLSVGDLKGGRCSKNDCPCPSYSTERVKA